MLLMTPVSKRLLRSARSLGPGWASQTIASVVRAPRVTRSLRRHSDPPFGLDLHRGITGIAQMHSWTLVLAPTNDQRKAGMSPDKARRACSLPSKKDT